VLTASIQALLVVSKENSERIPPERIDSVMRQEGLFLGEGLLRQLTLCANSFRGRPYKDSLVWMIIRDFLKDPAFVLREGSNGLIEFRHWVELGE
jgi:hypothetical protein